jgi:hypothetical protein
MSIKPIDTTVRTEDWERTVAQAVRSLRHGSVEVLVHEGRVVQVETRMKVRFTEDRRPESRRRSEEPDGRAHRPSGGAAPTREETNE